MFSTVRAGTRPQAEVENQCLWPIIMSLLLQRCRSFMKEKKKKISKIDFPRVTVILNDRKPIVVHVKRPCNQELLYIRVKMTFARAMRQIYTQITRLV